MKESLSDLKALQQSLPGPPNDYFDPLNLATMTFDWGPQGEEATIGWLRHSEIKHGRVAMAGFLGFIAHCTPLVSGEHKFLPYRGYVAGVTPQEQWDNIPLYGKLQILVAIGMLESYGEGAGDPEGYTHYMKGGKPGYYPPIAGRAGFGQVTLNLWFAAASARVLRSTVPAHDPSGCATPSTRRTGLRRLTPSPHAGIPSTSCRTTRRRRRRAA